MIKRRRISTILLFAILISSCATDRLQVSMRKDLECKTIKTRYDYGRNKPIQTINSDNRKYARYVYHATRNNIHNGIASKNMTKKDKHPGNLNYVLEENKNYPDLADFGKSEQNKRYRDAQFRIYFPVHELNSFNESVSDLPLKRH